MAVFDPGLWFGAMSVSAALRWCAFYLAEPWGNKEAGLRTGMLAIATGDGSTEVSVDDFVIAAPTKREARERQQWEEQAGEFERWKRGGINGGPR